MSSIDTGHLQDCIAFKWPGCSYSMCETYDSLVWESVSIPKPSQSDVQQALIDYEAYLLSVQYRKERQKAYASLGDQLDMLWHSMDSGEIPKSKDFYDSCKAVKDKYPKPK